MIRWWDGGVGAIYLCICPSIHPCKMTLSTSLSFFSPCCLIFTVFYILCACLIFFSIVCFIGLVFFLFGSFLYSVFICIFRWKENKHSSPWVPKSVTSLEIQLSPDTQTSPLLMATQKHRIPLCRWNHAPGMVPEPIPPPLSRDNQILSSVSWWIHTGTFGDTCSSAGSWSAAARAK